MEDKEDKEDKEATASPVQVQAGVKPDMTYAPPGNAFIKAHDAAPKQPLQKDDPVSGQKSKRRRTSPNDQAILEAAYLQNSKPDKAERAQIMSQIHMGEKEVQIWFQNRRQSDRRRSKPLEPHELMAHMRTTQTPPTTSTPTLESEDADSSTKPLSASNHAHPTPTPSPINESPPSPVSSQKDLIELPSTLEIESESSKGIGTPPSTMEEPRPGNALEPEATPAWGNKDEGGRLSSSGRKRNHAEMSRGDQRASHASPSPAEVTAPKSKEPLKRSSSVRLAMTAEGAVKIRTSDEPTPSPPKERALPPNVSQKTRSKSIRRSFSLFEEGAAPNADQVLKAPQLNAGFGRSRDPRTWEFYCDSKSKDALSTQVEAEKTGSAVGAINLIRSNSHKARGPVMSPALGKGNALVGAVKGKSAKPKLSRAQSSLARLQSSEADVSSLKQGPKQSRHVRSSSGDSDKENWAPGTRMSHNPLRRTQPSSSRRPILQSNETATFRDARPAGNPAGKAPAVKDSAGGDDLDCIQGLLSLSQGAWR